MPGRIDGDAVEHGEVAEVWYDRPYKTLWNRWGEPHNVPADPAMLVDLMAQGWTMHEPLHPEERPIGKKMRDGSIFMYEVAAQEVSEVERRRMARDPSEISSTVPSRPVATYYSPQGDKLEGLPADPESMKQYLELGLSLTPPQGLVSPNPTKPAKTAPARSRKLRAV